MDLCQFPGIQKTGKLHYPLYDFDLRATHARTLLPAALASVSFGFVLVRDRVRSSKWACYTVSAKLSDFQHRTWFLSLLKAWRAHI